VNSLLWFYWIHSFSLSFLFSSFWKVLLVLWVCEYKVQIMFWRILFVIFQSLACLIRLCLQWWIIPKVFYKYCIVEWDKVLHFQLQLWLLPFLGLFPFFRARYFHGCQCWLAHCHLFNISNSFSMAQFNDDGQNTKPSFQNNSSWSIMKLWLACWKLSHCFCNTLRPYFAG
jgi:hypothetical protein